MLSEKVLVQQGLLHPGDIGGELTGENTHIGNLFQYDCVVHRAVGIFTPGKRPVSIYQYGGNGDRTDTPRVKGFNNYFACIVFIILCDFGFVISRVQGIVP